MNRALLIAGAMIALCAVASAQEEATPPSDIDKLVGAPWEITNAARDKTCSVTFRKDRVRAGSRIEFDDECAVLFPVMKDVAAWKFADGDLLRLVDSRGKTLIEFSEVETGIFEAPTANVGLLFLQPPGSSEPVPQLAAEQMAGNWTLKRAARTLCELSLDKTPANDGFAMTVNPGCDAAIARLGFASWSLDQGELVLTPARGNVWRFEAGEAGAWRRVPETADPVTLVRP